MGVGHRDGQLRHLQEPHPGKVHRVSGQPDRRGLQAGMGNLQPRVSLTLHHQVVEDEKRVSDGQQRMGDQKSRKLIDEFSIYNFGQAVQLSILFIMFYVYLYCNKYFV